MTVPIFLDISGGEILLILFAVFILFGPKKVPEIARQIGKGMNDLRKVTNDLTKEFKEGAEELKQQANSVKSDIAGESNKVAEETKSGTDDISNTTQTFNKNVYNIPETKESDDIPHV